MPREGREPSPPSAEMQVKHPPNASSPTERGKQITEGISSAAMSFQAETGSASSTSILSPSDRKSANLEKRMASRVKISAKKMTCHGRKPVSGIPASIRARKIQIPVKPTETRTARQSAILRQRTSSCDFLQSKGPRPFQAGSSGNAQLGPSDATPKIPRSQLVCDGNTAFPGRRWTRFQVFAVG